MHLQQRTKSTYKEVFCNKTLIKIKKYTKIYITNGTRNSYYFQGNNILDVCAKSEIKRTTRVLKSRPIITSKPTIRKRKLYIFILLQKKQIDLQKLAATNTFKNKNPTHQNLLNKWNEVTQKKKINIITHKELYTLMHLQQQIDLYRSLRHQNLYNK